MGYLFALLPHDFHGCEDPHHIVPNGVENIHPPVVNPLGKHEAFVSHIPNPLVLVKEPVDGLVHEGDEAVEVMYEGFESPHQSDGDVVVPLAWGKNIQHVITEQWFVE